MKTIEQNGSKIGAMPRDYEALCRVYLPRLIHDQAEYESVAEIARVFAGFEEAMSVDQQDYFQLLCSLMEAWEVAHVKWPAVTPLETLKHLLAEHGMSAADLSRLLGASRQLGPMILRGERSITAEHARTMGTKFGVPAGVFIA
jgi:HTH-type transcriptional regulator/antitoxin HigA